MSCTSCSSPIDSCAIPRGSFERLGRYLSASDIGTSNTLSERFHDEDHDEDEVDEVDDDVVDEEIEQGMGGMGGLYNGETETMPAIIECNINNFNNENSENNEDIIDICSDVVSEVSKEPDLYCESRDDSCFSDVSLSDEQEQEQEQEELISFNLTVMGNDDRGDHYF